MVKSSDTGTLGKPRLFWKHREIKPEFVLTLCMGEIECNWLHTWNTNCYYFT